MGLFTFLRVTVTVETTSSYSIWVVLVDHYAGDVMGPRAV